MKAFPLFVVISALTGLPLGAVDPSCEPPVFEPKVDLAAGGNVLGPALRDLDGDGKLDVAGTLYNGGSGSQVVIFRNTSTTGSLAFASAVHVDVGSGPEGLAAADIDGDGKPELISANADSSTVTVVLNTSTPGNVSFGTDINLAAPTAHRLAVVDFDGDNKLDIAVTCNSPKQVRVFRNTSSLGSLSFSAAGQINTPDFPNGIAAGDVDTDGKADLVVPNDGKVFIYLNTTSGTSISFAAPVDFVAPCGDEAETGDLDNDGLIDLVVSRPCNSMVSGFRNLSSPGTVSFDTRLDFPTGLDPRGLAVQDLDADGRADLAVATNLGASLSVLRNLSDGELSFGEFVEYPSGTGAYLIKTGDLDADGAPDLAVTNEGAQTISLFRNKPADTCRSLYTITPCRVLDTREPAHAPALVAGTSRTFSVAGQCGLPMSARVIALNVTAISPMAQGHLRLYAGGTPLPITSTVNYPAGVNRTNNAILALGAEGTLSIYCDQISGGTHVAVDVTGYFD